jgi:DNA repair exonuclease SbcCD ATPase subunit
MIAPRADLIEIQEGIKAAEAHLETLNQAMTRLEDAGMYPAVPTEQWQSRNDSPPIYLYMIFRFDHRRGGYAGPAGKRKVYVGNKEERIAEARRLAKNRRLWEQLRRTASQLKTWLSSTERDIENLRRQAGNWPHLDAGLWEQLELGQPGQLISPPGGPNG